MIEAQKYLRSQPFNITDVKSISLEAYATDIGSNGAHAYFYAVASGYVAPATSNKTGWTGSFRLTPTTYTVDVSNLTGIAYVIVLGDHSTNNASSMTATKLSYVLKTPTRK